jgi:hypothetical protein
MKMFLFKALPTPHIPFSLVIFCVKEDYKVLIWKSKIPSMMVIKGLEELKVMF